jgi:hypothetical protein
MNMEENQIRKVDYNLLYIYIYIIIYINKK